MRTRARSLWHAVARYASPIALAAAFVFAGAVPALAVSERDLVALAQAGLSDDVLVALVEADDTVFPLDAPRILELRQQGLSERVIMAMLKNGRRTPHAPAQQVGSRMSPPLDPPTAVPDDPPSLVVIGEQPPAPPAVVQQTSVVIVPWVPILVPPIVGRPSKTHTLPPSFRGFGRFINDGWVEGRPPSGAR
jgi:hypothetical protein